MGVLEMRNKALSPMAAHLASYVILRLRLSFPTGFLLKCFVLLVAGRAPWVVHVERKELRNGLSNSAVRALDLFRLALSETTLPVLRSFTAFGS